MEAVLRFFFLPRCLEAAELEEGVGDHGHQGVSMQSRPRSAFEVVEAEFLLELLMRLLTDPSRFDCGCELSEARVSRQVRHIVFLLASWSTFADEPDLAARHALHTIVEHAMFMAVCNADAAGREETGQTTFSASPPVDPLPFPSSQQRFSRDWRLIRDVVFAASSGLLDGEYQRNVGGIDALASRQTYRPPQTALA